VEAMAQSTEERLVEEMMRREVDDADRNAETILFVLNSLNRSKGKVTMLEKR
jgi:hypothetical protein